MRVTKEAYCKGSASYTQFAEALLVIAQIIFLTTCTPLTLPRCCEAELQHKAASALQQAGQESHAAAPVAAAEALADLHGG